MSRNVLKFRFVVLKEPARWIQFVEAPRVGCNSYFTTRRGGIYDVSTVRGGLAGGLRVDQLRRVDETCAVEGRNDRGAVRGATVLTGFPLAFNARNANFEAYDRLQQTLDVFGRRVSHFPRRG